MPDTLVTIPFVGEVAFPDSMSDADIEKAAAKLHKDALDASRNKLAAANKAYDENAALNANQDKSIGGHIADQFTLGKMVERGVAGGKGYYKGVALGAAGLPLAAAWGVGKLAHPVKSLQEGTELAGKAAMLGYGGLSKAIDDPVEASNAAWDAFARAASDPETVGETIGTIAGGKYAYESPWGVKARKEASTVGKAVVNRVLPGYKVAKAEEAAATAAAAAKDVPGDLSFLEKLPPPDQQLPASFYASERYRNLTDVQKAAYDKLRQAARKAGEMTPLDPPVNPHLIDQKEQILNNPVIQDRLNSAKNSAPYIPPPARPTSGTLGSMATGSGTPQELIPPPQVGWQQARPGVVLPPAGGAPQAVLPAGGSTPAAAVADVPAAGATAVTGPSAAASAEQTATKAVIRDLTSEEFRSLTKLPEEEGRHYLQLRQLGDSHTEAMATVNHTRDALREAETAQNARAMLGSNTATSELYGNESDAAKAKLAELTAGTGRSPHKMVNEAMSARLQWLYDNPKAAWLLPLLGLGTLGEVATQKD